jgi:hypothetical protein
VLHELHSGRGGAALQAVLKVSGFVVSEDASYLHGHTHVQALSEPTKSLLLLRDKIIAAFGASLSVRDFHNLFLPL